MTPTPPPTDEPPRTTEGPTYVVHQPEGGVAHGEEVGQYTEINKGDTLVTGVKVEIGENGRGPVV